MRNFINIDKIIVVLILNDCIPVINEEWKIKYPVIDSNFKWNKAVLLLDSYLFDNKKSIDKNLFSMYEIKEIETYGKKLISWNFKIPFIIIKNILTSLVKTLTGNINMKTIRAEPLYEEDRELFEVERRKTNFVDKYTVVMLTYRRIPGLNYSLTQFNNETNVDKIIVIWNDPDLIQLPNKDQWAKSIPPVFFVKPTGNSLNNRFLPYDIIKTEAILSLDDDQRLTPSLLHYTFDVWKFNRDVLVGYSSKLTTKNDSLVYIAKKSETYDLLLTSLSMLNRKYLFYYTYNFPSNIKRYIDDKMNCEDIAMNFMIAILTNKPNALFTNVEDLSRCDNCIAHGLSKDKNHYIERSDCVELFSNTFGGNPMIESKFYLDVY
uniref:Glyco_transf_64 domain-containing protein n=1 Tax=Parastrongyloides trichosuri TaxID=131310 RepID=A0A0N4Z425_PARTI